LVGISYGLTELKLKEEKKREEILAKYAKKYCKEREERGKGCFFRSCNLLYFSLKHKSLHLY
jgi:hypothetical protein